MRKRLTLIAGTLCLVTIAAVSATSLFEVEIVPAVDSHRPADVEAVADEAVGLAVVVRPSARTELRTMGTPLTATQQLVARARGRVVDKLANPVSAAMVVVFFERAAAGAERVGIRRRRPRLTPKPLVTASDGTFVCRVPRSPDLRVILNVRHPDYAPARFERNLGEVSTDVDLGNLVVDVGGEVLGRVTDSRGLAIVGAQVRIYPQKNDPVRWLDNRDQTRTATMTDDQGRFRLGHIAAGDWLVTATAPRHQNGHSPTFSIAGEPSTELADIRLHSGHELVGFVTDRDRQPIAKAEVRLLAASGGRHFLARTDQQGRFVFRHLPATPFTLTADADGYLRREQCDVQAALQTSPLSLTLLDGPRIHGLVTDLATGRVVTNYAVGAVRLGELPEVGAGFKRLPGASAGMDSTQHPGRGSQWFVGGDIGRVESHPGGRFALRCQQEGIYLVAVQSPDHERWRSRVIELRAGSGAAEIAVTLARGLFVRGRVIDDHARALAGAHIELHAADVDDRRASSGVPVSKTCSDARGRFTFRHVPAGDYQILASAEHRDTTGSGRFELTSDVDGLVLALGALGTLEGKVLGVPRGGGEQVRVLALVAGRGLRRMGVHGDRLMVNVADDGSYRFAGLPPGSYYVRAFSRSPAEVVRELSPRPDGTELPADVVVRAGAAARLDVRFRRTQVGTVFGTVTNNGLVAERYHVELTRLAGARNEGQGGGRWVGFGNGKLVTMTDAAGRYTLARVSPGRYVAKVVGEGGRARVLATQEVAIATGRRVQVDFPLVTSPIRGRITAADGSDAGLLLGEVSFLPGLVEYPADFEAWRRDHRFARAPVRGGEFASRALPPGRYLIVLDLRGRKRVTRSVSLSPGRTLTVDLVAGRRR